MPAATDAEQCIIVQDGDGEDVGELQETRSPGTRLLGSDVCKYIGGPTTRKITFLILLM